jgi:hypothetical protein
MKLLLSFCLAQLLLCTFAMPFWAVAQGSKRHTEIHGTETPPAAGDYRSAATGDWSSNGTWETYNGTTWVPATQPPNEASGVITVRSPHVVTVSNNVAANQVAVNAGGSIIISTSGNFTITDATGTDLQVEGGITVAGTLNTASGTVMSQSASGSFTVSGAGTVNVGIGGSFLGGGPFNIGGTGGIVVGSTATANFNSTVNVNPGVGNTFEVEGAGQVNFGGASVLNIQTGALIILGTTSIGGGVNFSTTGNDPEGPDLQINNNTTTLTPTATVAGPGNLIVNSPGSLVVQGASPFTFAPPPAEPSNLIVAGANAGATFSTDDVVINSTVAVNQGGTLSGQNGFTFTRPVEVTGGNLIATSIVFNSTAPVTFLTATPALPANITATTTTYNGPVFVTGNEITVNHTGNIIVNNTVTATVGTGEPCVFTGTGLAVNAAGSVVKEGAGLFVLDIITGTVGPVMPQTAPGGGPRVYVAVNGGKLEIQGFVGTQPDPFRGGVFVSANSILEVENSNFLVNTTGSGTVATSGNNTHFTVNDQLDPNLNFVVNPNSKITVDAPGTFFVNGVKCFFGGVIVSIDDIEIDETLELGEGAKLEAPKVTVGENATAGVGDPGKKTPIRSTIATKSLNNWGSLTANGNLQLAPINNQPIVVNNFGDLGFTGGVYVPAGDRGQPAPFVTINNLPGANLDFEGDGVADVPIQINQFNNDGTTHFRGGVRVSFFGGTIVSPGDLIVETNASITVNQPLQFSGATLQNNGAIKGDAVQFNPRPGGQQTVIKGNGHYHQGIKLNPGSNVRCFDASEINLFAGGVFVGGAKRN